MDDLIFEELKHKSGALDDLKVLLERLRMENNSLLEELQRKEKDSFDVISYLRNENDALKDKFRGLMEEMEASRQSNEKNASDLSMSFSSKQKQLTEDFRTTLEERDDKIRELASKLDDLQKFQEMKTTLTAELESYKAELAETQTKNKDTLADLDRKLIEEKAKLQKELAQKLGEIKQNSEQEVINRLDSTTKKILVENEKLMMDLRLHVKETEEQGKRIAALQEENQRLKRDLELNEQSLLEYGKHSYRQSKEIKELNTKVKNLEQSLSQVIRDFERERERLIVKAKKEMEDYVLESEGMKKLLKHKTREQGKIKKLAQEIVSQRTEVEQFFLDALDTVKEEIQKGRLNAAAGPGHTGSEVGNRTFLTSVPSGEIDGIGRNQSSSRLPRLQQSARSQLPVAPNQKVDIRDLTWEDKERVLRLLFSRINQAQLPPPVVMPPHSFDMRS